MSDPSHHRCARCESLPERLGEEGHLHLWFPVWHSFMKATRWLNRMDLDHEVMPDAPALVLSLDAETAGKLAENLQNVLSQQEFRHTKALLLEEDRELRHEDFGRVTSLSRFLGRARSNWLLDLLQEERLTAHFQPLVDARDTGRVMGYEVLMRGVDPHGELISPARILEAAREADLLFQVDLAARRTAIQEAASSSLDGAFFINFAPSAIYDPAFCLRSTVETVKASGIAPERVVFEVIETEQAADLEHLKSILSYYQEAGFRMALDDLGAGYSSLVMMNDLRPDFVKLDLELSRGVARDPYKSLITRKCLELAQDLGITTVAEGIETEEDLEWMRQHGVDLVQGRWIQAPAAASELLDPDPSPQ